MPRRHKNEFESKHTCLWQLLNCNWNLLRFEKCLSLFADVVRNTIQGNVLTCEYFSRVNQNSDRERCVVNVLQTYWNSVAYIKYSPTVFSDFIWICLLLLVFYNMLVQVSTSILEITAEWDIEIWLWEVFLISGKLLCIILLYCYVFW